MNTTPARKVACTKCRGTGTVERFLDYEGGVCFDCNGTGRVAHVEGNRSKIVPVKCDMVEVGLRVTATTKGAPTETIVSFHRHPELPVVTVVTTAEGGEYLVNPNFASPLVLA